MRAAVITAALVLLLAAPAARADEPARLIQKVLRSPDAKRDWTLSYQLQGRRLRLTCDSSDTGRCGVRLIDAPRLDASASELHIEWLGLQRGQTVERTVKGAGYALCVRPDVGQDDACPPLDQLTAL